MRHYKLITYLTYIFSTSAFCQPFSYSEKVELIEKTECHVSDLLEYHDTINSKLIDYNCNDTIFSDSCVFSRALYLDNYGRIYKDSNVVGYDMYKEPIVGIKNLRYSDNYIVISDYKITSLLINPKKEKFDSLVIDSDNKLLEHFQNGDLFQFWKYDFKNRLIYHEEFCNEKLKSKISSYDYRTDTIVSSISEETYGKHNIIKRLMIFNKDSMIVTEEINQSRIKYYFSRREVHLDSIISSQIDTVPYIVSYRYNDNITEETNSFNNDLELYEYDNLRRLVEHKSIQTGASWDTLSYCYDYLSDKEVVLTKYDSEIKRKVIIDRFPNDKIAQSYSESYDSNKTFRRECIRNNIFGKTILNYRFDREKLIHSKLTIEQ